MGGSRVGINIVATSDDEHSTLAMVRAGMGYGLVQHSLAQKWVQRGSVVGYEEPSFSVNVNLLVRKDRLKRLTIMWFIALVRQNWAPESLPIPVAPDQ